MLLSLLFGLTASATPTPSVGPGSSKIRWEPYVGRAADGSELEGRLGRMDVPERWADPDGDKIEIAFVVYESQNPDPGPPFFYLVGGPGGPGIESCGQEATDPRTRLLERGDVIGIDQRGTGRCVPNLSEAPAFTFELPFDEPAERDEVASAFRAAVGRCMEHWQQEGVDLGAYNSVESADDVDAVREALGYSQIVPWGTSYGSHLGLAYLRRHAEHAARAVLMKVEGPDDTFKLPSEVQKRLERVHEMVAADPVLSEKLPDFLGTVHDILAQLAEEPVRVTTMHAGQEIELAIGPHDVQTALSSAIGYAQTIGDLPFVVYLMSQGEFRHMSRTALGNRIGEVGSAMPLAVDCASGVSAARLERIERERKDEANLLSDAIAAPYFPESCEPWGTDLGDEFRSPFECDVPVLFVSGDLDSKTPPLNVEVLEPGFPNAVHVIVNGTGHDSRELESEAYLQLLDQFLNGEAVENTTIELPALQFRPF